MKRLNVNIADEEMAFLDKICASKEMTKTELIREWIRRLMEDANGSGQ